LWSQSSWQRDHAYALSNQLNFSSLSWSPDGNHLAVGGSFAELFTNRLEPKGRLSSGISSSAVVAFAPNGATVTAAGWEIAIWDAKSRSPLNVQESVGFSDGWLDWSADAGTLAFGTPRRLTWMFWRSDDSHKVRTARGRQLALSPSAPLIAIEDLNKRTVRICDANTLEQRHLLDGYYDMYSIQMAWHPRETILASVQSTTSIRLTNAESGETIKVLSKEAADPFGTALLVWAPTGRTLCSVGSEVAYLWDTETGKPTQVLNHPKNQQVTAVAWSSDGKTLATGCRDSVIRLWDVETGRTKDVLRGHAAPVLAVAWLDEQTLASVGVDAKNIVWDTATGTKTGFDSPYLKMHSFNGVFWKMARFSPNGEILATSSDHAIRFQNVRTGTHRGSLVIVPSEPPMPIAISTEGHYDGPQGAIREIVYVVQTAAGQATLSPSEFAKKYGFENNPGRVHLTQ
jgi:WD40 repeat protein